MDPANPVVALCAQGMAVKGNPDEALRLFEQAWAAAVRQAAEHLAALPLGGYSAFAAMEIDRLTHAIQSGAFS